MDYHAIIGTKIEYAGGRSPLAFLAKLLILFLVYLFLISLERCVVYTITQAKHAQNKEQNIK